MSVAGLPCAEAQPRTQLHTQSPLNNSSPKAKSKFPVRGTCHGPQSYEIGDMAEGRMGCQARFRLGTERFQGPWGLEPLEAVAMRLPAPGRSGPHHLLSVSVVLNFTAYFRTFPTCTRQCVVVVGGENGDEDDGREVLALALRPLPLLSPEDWSEDESTASLARQFSTVLVFDAEEGAWRPTNAARQSRESRDRIKKETEL